MRIMSRVESELGHKKVKTSISLRPQTLEELKRIARRENRSVSNLIEHFLEEKLREFLRATEKKNRVRKPS